MLAKARIEEGLNDAYTYCRDELGMGYHEYHGLVNEVADAKFTYAEEMDPNVGPPAAQGYCLKHNVQYPPDMDCPDCISEAECECCNPPTYEHTHCEIHGTPILPGTDCFDCIDAELRANRDQFPGFGSGGHPVGMWQDSPEEIAEHAANTGDRSADTEGYDE
jgi:hypothetical protein